MTDEDFYPPGLARRKDAPYEDDEIADGIEEFDDLLDIPAADEDDDDDDLFN